MKLWFSSAYHSAPYSLRKHTSNINKLLLKIKPPNEVLRRPRSVDNMSFYKASEYRAWLLFYSLPILSNFLPTEYTHHLSLLVSATHILLSDNIKTDDLELVNQMLLTFYQSAGDLYSINVYTSNMHSLVHLVSLMKLWGPLWAYSMFGFENINGYLGTTFHGTKKITSQMTFFIQLKQTLPGTLQELRTTESTETKTYINSTINKQKRNMHKISDGLYVIGKMSLHVLTANELTIVCPGLPFQNIEVHKFKRVFTHNTVFCSAEYFRAASRDNTMCSFRLTTGEMGYSQIKLFFLQNSTPFCIMEKFAITTRSHLTHFQPSHKAITDLLKHHLSCQVNCIDETTACTSTDFNTSGKFC